MIINIRPKVIETNEISDRISIKIYRSNSDSDGSVTVVWNLLNINEKIVKSGSTVINNCNRDAGDDEIAGMIAGVLGLTRTNLSDLRKMKTRIVGYQVENRLATIFSINQIQIREFGGSGVAIASWTLCDDEQGTLCEGSTAIEGEEYAAWGADDSYILQLLTGKLGLAPITEGAPSTTPENSPGQETISPTA